MKRNERVLLVASAKATAARAARRVVAAGGEAIAVAAQMMLDARMGQIEFSLPTDESLAYDEPLSGVRSTSGRVDVEEMAHRVA